DTNRGPRFRGGDIVGLAMCCEWGQEGLLTRRYAPTFGSSAREAFSPEGEVNRAQCAERARVPDAFDSDPVTDLPRATGAPATRSGPCPARIGFRDWPTKTLHRRKA